VLGAALARGHAADDLGAVVEHLLGVEGALLAGEALHDHLGVLVDQNAHVIFLWSVIPTGGRNLLPNARWRAKQVSRYARDDKMKVGVRQPASRLRRPSWRRR